MKRGKDWFRQSEADLDAAKNLLESKNYEWACFVAQQSAEKSVKGKRNQFGYEVRGHSIVELLETLEKETEVTEEIKTAGRKLDLYYIPSRYPDAYPSGALVNKFDKEMAKEAVKLAEQVNAFTKK